MPFGRPLFTAVLPLAVGLAAVGCNGSIGNPEGMNGPPGSGTGTGTGTGTSTGTGMTGNPPGATGGTSTTTGGPNDPCDATGAFAPPRLWRLNDEQYGNVVHDIFGSDITVPPDVSEAISAGAEDLARAE